MTRTSIRPPSTIALALVTGIGPFSTDTYLAALPELQSSLGTSPAAAQLTITACIVGLAIGMLLGGTLSDGIGRRAPLLATTAAFLIASIVAAVAPDIVTLLICRLLQGLASGAAASIGRAVVSDRYDGLDAAKRFGTLATIGLIAPVIAPAIGAGVIGLGDWRSVFVLMAALGALQVLAVLLGVPETLDRDAARSSDAPGLRARIAAVVGVRSYRSASLVGALATAGFFVYIGGSSFVLRGHYGLDEHAYSLLFAVNALAMTVASLIFRLLVARVAVARLRGIGLGISTAAATVMLIVAVLLGGDPPLALVWAALLLVVGGMGLTQPSTTVMAQEAGRAAPGTAASLQNGFAFLVGAAATPLSGAIDDSSVSVMLGLMTAFFAVTATLAVLAPRRERRLVVQR